MYIIYIYTLYMFTLYIIYIYVCMYIYIYCETSPIVLKLCFTHRKNREYKKQGTEGSLSEDVQCTEAVPERGSFSSRAPLHSRGPIGTYWNLEII